MFDAKSILSRSLDRTIGKSDLVSAARSQAVAENLDELVTFLIALISD
jgi:hypothetical protein